MKPVTVFDRDQEWGDLEAFATAPGRDVRLGLLYGRRRQGKSFLLRALTAGTDGFYHLALEEGRKPALQRFGRQVAARLGVGGALAFDDWEGALRAAGRLPTSGGPLLVVLDEFPYLLPHSPEVPSILQMLYDESRSTDGPAVRVVLCGSAMSIMSRLLSGTKALRGRARLDMPLAPFDFRQARAYWQIADLDVAFTVHALLGGTPGYLDLIEDDPPETLHDLGGWLGRSLLNPSHALFREADYLLSEEPTVTDRGLYQSALGAISRASRRRQRSPRPSDATRAAFATCWRCSSVPASSTATRTFCGGGGPCCASPTRSCAPTSSSYGHIWRPWRGVTPSGCGRRRHARSPRRSLVLTSRGSHGSGPPASRAPRRWVACRPRLVRPS